MAIATVPGSEFVNTPTSGVKRSFAALNAPNQAAGQFADAVGDVGAMVGDFAFKLQAAKNFGIAADADREMRQAAASFRESRRGRTDEENWGTEWQETAQATRDKIYDTHAVGPQLKKQLESSLKSWDQSNLIEVQTLARKQAINRAGERISTAADDAAKDGDEQTINHLFDGASKTGVYFPEEAEKMKKGYLNKIDQYAAQNYIDSFPVGAVEFLEAKDGNGKPVNLTRLDPGQRNRLVTEARQKMHAYQADNLDGIRAQLDNGEDISDAFISLRQEKKEISSRGAAGLRNYIRSKGLKDSQDEFYRLQAEVLNYDATAVKDPQAWAANIKADAVALPTKFQNSLTRQINAKLETAKRKDALEEKPIERETYARLERDFKEGFMLPGQPEVETKGMWWWKTETPTGNIAESKNRGLPLEKWEKGNEDGDHPSLEERKAVHLHYAEQMGKLKDFFDQHPNATYPEAEEFRQKLVAPYLISQAGKALAQPAAAPAAQQPAKKPAGAAFFSQSTGKWYDKDKKVIQ